VIKRAIVIVDQSKDTVLFALSVENNCAISLNPSSCVSYSIKLRELFFNNWIGSNIINLSGI
jgi:hypothetical protein